MKKIWIAVVLIAAIGIFFAFKRPTSRVNTPTPQPQPVNFIASFEIIEKGKKRDFDDQKYFNLNTDTYISSLDPQYIHLKKTGVTWREFFAIHKIEIDKKPTLTLNNLEDKDALDKEITPGAKLLIEYK